MKKDEYEPNPSSLKLLQVNRPDDELFNNAICSKQEHVHFVDHSKPAVTGVCEFMAPSFRDRWHKNVKVENLRKILCLPLHSVFTESKFKGKLIDFLSLDVESGEFEVIKTINFEEVQFGLIFYEADQSALAKFKTLKKRPFFPLFARCCLKMQLQITENYTKSFLLKKKTGLLKSGVTEKYVTFFFDQKSDVLFSMFRVWHTLSKNFEKEKIQIFFLSFHRFLDRSKKCASLPHTVVIVREG